MGRLFKRASTLNVQGKVLQGLDFEFHVDRNLKPTSNTAEFTIYNLSPDNRKFLQTQKGGVAVELHGGYADELPNLPLIFLGQLKEVTTVRDGADWVTTVTSGDGPKKERLAFSLGPGAGFEQAVRKVIAEMGIEPGSSLDVLKTAKFGDKSNNLAEGYTAYGRSTDELEALLNSAGLEHSFQNGKLQILKRNSALNSTAVTLTQATGLVGSPELDLKKGVKFRSLLNAAIFPGRLVHISSANLDGFFRVERGVYSGQTAGGDWYVDGEAKAVNTA